MSPTSRNYHRSSGWLLLLAVILAGSLLPEAATALVRFDFEQKFYVHPGHQVWDFSLVKSDSLYHIYYHAIPDATPSASRGDTIWHATTLDLKHWSIQGPVLAVGTADWEAGAMWAPGVVRDEAGGRWVMAYTACDTKMNQRIALAYSPDLFTWTKEPANPVLEPDSTLYQWSPSVSWSNFRDPFLWQDDGTWHILVTAKKYYSSSTGILYHATSPDLLFWTDQGPMFINDGSDPWRVPESPQYRLIGQYHHLLFCEYDTGFVSLVSGTDPAQWTMDERVVLEPGAYAPELNDFAEGNWIYSRITPFHLPQSDSLTYVVRLDTLLTAPDGASPAIHMPHPLDENWASHQGISVEANPTFGDNPLWRGEPSSGMVGNGYFSSREYYQGPLSGKGAPGVSLGDAVQGSLDSRPFTVTGDQMTLLVGGGDYPATCYVALMTAADSTVLYTETGQGHPTMTLRTWDLRPYRGLECFLRIVDHESASEGYIDVDEITESRDDLSAAPPARSAGPVLSHDARPNPFNPMTVITFDLAVPAPAQLVILDARGRRVWVSPTIAGQQGLNQLRWRGRDRLGSPAASGTYLYIIEIRGVPAATGKICLTK